MEIGKIVSFVITFIIISIVMYFLNKGAGKTIAPNKDGSTQLRMNKMIQFFGWGTMGLALFGSIMIIIEDASMYLFSAFMLFLFGGLAFIILAYYKNHQVIFDDKSILVKNWRGKEGMIDWSNIAQIKYRSLSGYIVIKDQNDTTIKIHHQLVGLRSFIEKLEEKTDWKGEDLKLPNN